MNNRRSRTSSNESRYGGSAAVVRKIKSRLTAIDDAIKVIEAEHADFTEEFNRRLRFGFSVEQLENLFVADYANKVLELVDMDREIANNRKRVITLERRFSELLSMPMYQDCEQELKFWKLLISTVNAVISNQQNLIGVKTGYIFELKRMIKLLKQKAQIDRSLAFATTAELKNARRNLILERNHLQSILRKL